MKSIIKKVAGKHGVSEAEVEREIKNLIQFCMDNPDPCARAKFDELKQNRRDITPQELIDLLCLKLFRKINR